MTNLKPQITVVIATYNSELYLPNLYISISNQTYPKELVEILVVDGGSSDLTKSLCYQYSWTVMDNKDGDPVNAKSIGCVNASGKYITFIDHDELLLNERSFEKRISFLEENQEYKYVLSTGYKNPDNYPFINEYINEFGDPFSFFVYKTSKSGNRFLNSLITKHSVLKKSCSIIGIKRKWWRCPPLIELCAAANVVNLQFIRNNILNYEKPDVLTHWFSIMDEMTIPIAISSNDLIEHHSSDSVKRYLNKIKWRVRNNIFGEGKLGHSGYKGRQKFENCKIRMLKKYIYIPYTLLFIPSLVDTIYLIATRKNWRYYIHYPLSIYTAILIATYGFLNFLGFKIIEKKYDGSAKN